MKLRPTVSAKSRLHFLKFKSEMNQSGASIIEVLAAFGLMAILMAAMVSVFTSQQKEARALSEKLAILDLEKLLINSLANGAICTAELATTTFNSSGPYKINTSNLSGQLIQLKSLHASSVAGSPSLVSEDTPASPLAQHLVTESIRFKNFVSTGTPNEFLVDLVISFKNSQRTMAPTILKMSLKTDPTDPPTAKKITSCLESGQGGNSYRYVFNSSQNWTVPPGVKSAFVTMAGAGSSGAGWRMQNAISSGHSGGYVFSHPVNLTPGEVLTVTIGKGGKGFPAISTGVFSSRGSPFYIWTMPSGDDGLGGYPGGATILTSPTRGVLLECDGGSGAIFNGVDSYSADLVAGAVTGAITGSGAPAFPSPNRIATGPFATADGPGACGSNIYGKGNPGTRIWDISSGYYPGGLTPFGFGSGGSVVRSGCYVNSTTLGTCTFPHDGRDGVIYIDVWQ